MGTGDILLLNTTSGNYMELENKQKCNSFCEHIRRENYYSWAWTSAGWLNKHCRMWQDKNKFSHNICKALSRGLWPCPGVLAWPGLLGAARVAPVGLHSRVLLQCRVALSHSRLSFQRWDSRFMHREIFSVVLRYVFVAGNMVPLWHRSLGTPCISRSWINCTLNIILW